VLGRIDSEALRRSGPSFAFAYVFIRREAFEGFEGFGEIIGRQEGAQMLLEVAVRLTAYSASAWHP
jgi:hypothetical protein